MSRIAAGFVKPQEGDDHNLPNNKSKSCQLEKKITSVVFAKARVTILAGEVREHLRGFAAVVWWCYPS